MDVGVFDAIILDNSGAALGVVPEMQHVCSLGHVNDVFAVEDVVGCHAVHGLPHTQAINVIRKGYDKLYCTVSVPLHARHSRILSSF